MKKSPFPQGRLRGDFFGVGCIPGLENPPKSPFKKGGLSNLTKQYYLGLT